MPNWVYNTLIIKGDQLNIARVKKQVAEPFTRKFSDYKSINGELKQVDVENTFSNPIFAFWNIIKPEDMHAYLYDEGTGVPDDPNDEKAWFQSNNWYDWNVRNWGTKWDVAVMDKEEYPETALIYEDEGNVTYAFNTAWSPPRNAIATLSKQYPSLNFDLDYEEETGWGGDIEFNNGEETIIEEYEWKCRECDGTEDETPFCDECQTDICPQCGYGEPTEECEKHKEKVNG